MFIRLVVGVVVVAVVVGLAGPASAHTAGGGADVHMAQTLAGTELTVVIRRTHPAPGPLYVDLIVHQPAPELTIGLTVRSTVDNTVATGEARLDRGRAGTYPVVLQVRASGAHELELRALDELSVLPFQVWVPRMAKWEVVVYGGFAVTGLSLAGAMVLAACSRRTTAKAVGGCSVLALVVAVTVAVLSPQLVPAAPGGTLARPYAQAIVATEPALPVVGEEFTLRLDLVDGSTGRPVDDLSPHHAALAHLVVTSEDGGYFRHVHPLRTAAGRLEVRLLADRPGRYLAHAEIERAGSGGQVVSGAFDVAPGVPRASGEPDHDGAAWTLRPQRPVAGRPVTIEIDVGTTGLQPWLGMAGHLIIRDRAGDFLGHVHESAAHSPPARGPMAGTRSRQSYRHGQADDRSPAARTDLR